MRGEPGIRYIRFTPPSPPRRDIRVFDSTLENLAELQIYLRDQQFQAERARDQATVHRLKMLRGSLFEILEDAKDAGWDGEF